MYERFWQQMGDITTIVISGWQSMSYFSDVKNLCWFLEPEFAKQIIRLHKIVGNAVTDNYYIVVGTGSTQLFQAALYALSPPNASEPMSVVSAAPFYSSYPSVTDFLKSGLYKWAGDANNFNKDGPYIELVTSPNNPDGSIRQPVVNRSGENLVHDFAYYWPQYTPISSPADHDLMLFTVSKATGHAGMRLGWALVKDEEVAKKMTSFIELNTIGVSKDSQQRAAKILQVISDSYEPVGNPKQSGPFFHFSHSMMEERWKALRSAVKQSGLFSLPEFPSSFCNFLGQAFGSQPAFAWLKCEGGIEDCGNFLKKHKILTRNGKHFGASPEYVRVSMLDRDESFNLFTKRLSSLHLSQSKDHEEESP
ncbi:Tryptophan aminotransferase-related protein 2 [Vitis vinifera]|uniref:Tryptophan aminotransferase-related protein 2 n=1 Tax=Vitis vinifera TaxID=29760 RepID=A0A438EYW6_VITVI|nr:Tryptophan aminotransferase-related protein 2 [Vitis vinifera]